MIWIRIFLFPDTTYLDVIMDPLVSDFLWETMGTSVLDGYPDLQYLCQQLGRRIKEHIDESAYRSLEWAAHRHLNKYALDDMPQINKILSEVEPAKMETTKPALVADSAFGIDRSSMNKCRKSDPYLALIQTAIYFEPQELPINFHKAAEEFALSANTFTDAIAQEPKRLHQGQHPVNNVDGQKANTEAYFKQSTVPFKPSLSSTPIKNRIVNDIKVAETISEPGVQSFSTYTNFYQHLPCTNYMPWYNQLHQHNSVFLYPQTLLMASPKAPTVFPDMTSEWEATAYSRQV